MTPYIFFNSCVTKNLGFGYAHLGYFRFTFNPLLRWVKSSDYRGRGLHSWVDNYGSLWKGWAFKGVNRGGDWLSFRYYRLIATHFSIGPFTLSYVRDREGYGPIGPVWPRTARQR